MGSIDRGDSRSPKALQASEGTDNIIVLEGVQLQMLPHWL